MRRGMSSSGAAVARNASSAYGPAAQVILQRRAVSKKARGGNNEGPLQVSPDMINYLKEELLSTWDAYLIPDYHRAVFLDCIYGLLPTQYLPILAKEIEDLKRDVAPI
jgi:hypothetical protein